MNARILLLISATSILISNCGGSSNDTVGSVVPVTSTPITPVTPPPPTISLAGSSTMIGRIFFFPTGNYTIDNNTFSVFSDRQGKYPTNSPIFQKNYGPVKSDYIKYIKYSVGIDTETNLLLGFRSPAGATVISPLTHILSDFDDQITLKDQLGLTVGPSGLSKDRDLLTFDPVNALSSNNEEDKQDGEKILSAHVKLIALSIALYGSHTPVRFSHQDFATISNHIANYPRLNLFDQSSLIAMFQRKENKLTSEQYLALSELVIKFFATIPNRITSKREISRYILGSQGFLSPLFYDIWYKRTPDAISKANSFTVENIRQILFRYEDAINYSSNDRYFAQPDFFRIRQGENFVIPTNWTGSNTSFGPLTANDVTLESATDTYFSIYGFRNVDSVETPIQNADRISVNLNSDGSVTMRSLGSFTGVTYFDYVGSHPNGATGRGRVYVWIE